MKKWEIINENLIIDESFVEEAEKEIADTIREILNNMGLNHIVPKLYFNYDDNGQKIVATLDIILESSEGEVGHIEFMAKTSEPQLFCIDGKLRFLYVLYWNYSSCTNLTDNENSLEQALLDEIAATCHNSTTIDIKELIAFRDKSFLEGKSEQYMQALTDLINNFNVEK